MDIFVENLKEIQENLTSPELAKKWGLLSLCRMEYSFNKFTAFDNLELDFSFSEIVDECINYVCHGKNFDMQNRIKQINSCFEMLYNYEEQNPEKFFCLSIYCSRTMETFCEYLESLATDKISDFTIEFILNTISEDFFIDYHELESLEELAEHKLVLEEIDRIWKDYAYIQTCTSEQLQKQAEIYRKLNVQGIPEHWSFGE